MIGTGIESEMELAQLLGDLEVLVNTESPSLDHARLAVSAAALAAIIEQRLGSAPDLVDGPNGPHVHWRGGGSPTVLVVGHHDTVFPAGTVAQRPFAVLDGRATGPGVYDMKAGIVQSVHAVASLADRSGIELLFTSDEEIGSTSSRALIEERARACGAVLVLEPSADGGALKTARKGTGGFEVLVHGRASHAGLEPEKGINSLIAAAELIAHIATLGDTSTGTTVTPTMISGGTAENVVPALTKVVVDVRVNEAAEKDRVESAMAALSSRPLGVDGVRVEVTGGIERPPMHPSASAELFPLAQQVASAQDLGPLDGKAVGGGSDGNFTAAIGVPTLDGLGAVGGGAHADHEYVEVAAMVPRARLVAGLIDAIRSR